MAKAVDILDDGTLIVITRHYDKVRRVLVQHGTKGTLYYPDDFIDENIRIEYCDSCENKNEPRNGVICRHCYMQPCFYKYEGDDAEGNTRIFELESK